MRYLNKIIKSLQGFTFEEKLLICKERQLIFDIFLLKQIADSSKKNIYNKKEYEEIMRVLFNLLYSLQNQVFFLIILIYYCKGFKS